MRAQCQRYGVRFDIRHGVASKPDPVISSSSTTFDVHHDCPEELQQLAQNRKQVVGHSRLPLRGVMTSANLPRARENRAATWRRTKTFYVAKDKRLSKSVEQCKHQQSVRNRRRRKDETAVVGPIVSAKCVIQKEVAEQMACGVSEVRNADCVQALEQIGILGEASFEHGGEEATTQLEVPLTSEDREAAHLLSAVQVKYPQIRSRIPAWLREKLPSCLPNGRLNRKLVKLKFWLLDNDSLKDTAGYMPALKVVSNICMTPATAA